MIRTLDDLEAEGAALGVRVDINSPLSEGRLADDARLRAHVDTLDELCRRGARVAVLAHQGRPGGDEFSDLSSHADRLDELLEAPVDYCDATFTAAAREAVAGLESGRAVLLENTRFYSEEYMSFEPAAAADTYLVARLAPALDAYVNDAFAAAHRKQPSIVSLGAASAGVVNERSHGAVKAAGDLLDDFSHRIYVPRDVAVEGDGERVEVDLGDLPTEAPAMDIGARTLAAYADILEDAGTAILNGPPGVFEDERFEFGTRELYRAATRSEMSVVGGGDTAAAMRRLDVEGFDHVSTGGGAALRMLSGERLPGVEVLRR